MKKLFKRIAMVILTLCFSICFSSVLNAAAVLQNDRVTVFLNSNEDVDLSGVVVKVYKKINIVPLSQGLTSFEVEYINSAHSNADGKISFERPDGPFMIEFDLKTLPSGMGLKKQTFTCNSTDFQSETINLYSVISTEAYVDGEDLNFIFKDSNKENLIVNYEVDSHNVTNNGSAKSSVKVLSEKYSGAIDCTITHFGNVNVNGTLFPYRVDEAYSELDYLQYISLLYDKGCVTRDEQIFMLCGFLESRYGENYHDEEMKAVLQSMKTESSDLKVQAQLDNTISDISTRSHVEDSSTLTYVSSTFYCTQATQCCSNGQHSIKVYYSSSSCDYATAD